MTRTRARAGSSQEGNDGDLPPPPPPSANEFFAQFLGSQEDYGGNPMPHCIEHGSPPPTATGARAKSVQHFQGFLGYQASYLQGG